MRSQSAVLLLWAAFAASTITALAQPAKSLVAKTPPMGWNSWDAYGLTIDEAGYRANTTVLAGIKQFGWLYSVIDEGWYMQDPFADKLATRKYLWNSDGILIPTPNRFPSSANNAGFKPIADWVHAQGLKFGIHIIRGIPRQVVDQNLPIAGGSFHAKDAADIPSTCPWDDGNYGVSDTPAGQAYYDSMIKLYAGWGLDYIKVDCIADHTYRPTEIKQIALAIERAKRPIVLSLSPGPTAIDRAPVVSKNAQMWRISDDHWDVWHDLSRKPGNDFPSGTYEAFDRIAQWQSYAKPGNWPDPDMLPFGSLTPHPGWGQPRESRLTHEEERTELTLWAISRSPLILGANLTKLDDFTRSLITNKEVLALNQTAIKSDTGLLMMRDGSSTPDPQRLWSAETASPAGASHPKRYVAVFNLGDTAASWDLDWMRFHLAAKDHAAYDIWNGKQLPAAKSLHVELQPHACALFRVD